MEATEQELRDMIPDISSLITSATIVLHLADAKARVIQAGITEAHAQFSILQRLLTLHIMSISNIVGKEITSEKVSDVGINYKSTGTNSLYSTNWEKTYHQILVSIQGMCDIIL